MSHETGAAVRLSGHAVKHAHTEPPPARFIYRAPFSEANFGRFDRRHCVVAAAFVGAALGCPAGVYWAEPVIGAVAIPASCAAGAAAAAWVVKKVIDRARHGLFIHRHSPTVPPTLFFFF